MLKDDVLKREIQAVMGQVCGLLSSSISLFNSPPSKLTLRSCEIDSVACGIKGHLIVQEDTLCSLELMVKPTKTSPLIKSIFREDKQWKLQQIQDAMNHLKMAFSTISMFGDPDRCNMDRYSTNYVIDLLGNLLGRINLSRKRLFSPCKLSLEALISSGALRMFSPTLPGDSIVNFYVLEDRLIITHYTVQQNHTQLTKSPRPLYPDQLFHSVGSILEHSGSLYEIVTAHRSYCQIPWLSEVVAATEICLQLGNQLKEKLTLSRDDVVLPFQNAEYAR